MRHACPFLVVAALAAAVGCGESTSTPGGGGGSSSGGGGGGGPGFACTASAQCMRGLECRGGTCRTPIVGDTVGDFPERVRLEMTAPYPAVATPDDDFDAYTTNYVEVEGACGESCGGVRRLGVVSAELAIDLDDEGLVFRSGALRMQDVEISRLTVQPSGLYVGDIVVGIERGDHVAYSSQSADRLAVAAPLTATVQLDVGLTKETAAPLFSADNPFRIEGLPAEVELRAEPDGSIAFSVRATATAEDDPIFELEFGNSSFAIIRAEMRLVGSSQ